MLTTGLQVRVLSGEPVFVTGKKVASKLTLAPSTARPDSGQYEPASEEVDKAAWIKRERLSPDRELQQNSGRDLAILVLDEGKTYPCAFARIMFGVTGTEVRTRHTKRPLRRWLPGECSRPPGMPVSYTSS